MFRDPDSEAKGIAAVNWKCQEITLGHVEPTLSYSQIPFLQPPELEYAQTNKEVDVHILQCPSTTPYDDNIHQNLLQKKATTLNNLSPFIFYGHDPSFAKAVNRSENSPYTEIYCGNSSFRAQGRHRNSPYGTTPVGIAPRDRHTDGRTMVVFSDELPMSSTSSGQALGRSYGQGPCLINAPVHYGPVASSSQPVCATIGQHTPLQCRSAVQIYKKPVATSSDSITITTKRGDDEGHHSTRYWCYLCNANFYAKKGLNRHIKDKHLPWNTCPLCSDFQWPKGRKYSFEKHLQSRHRDDLGAMHEVFATIWLPDAPRNDNA